MNATVSAERLSLNDVLITEELNTRPARPSGYAGEIAALSELVQCLAESPKTVLQVLADKVVDLTGADSSGISIEETDDGKTRVQVARERRRIRAVCGRHHAALQQSLWNCPRYKCYAVDARAGATLSVSPAAAQADRRSAAGSLLQWGAADRHGMGDRSPQKQAVRQRGLARHHEPLPIRRGRSPEFAQSGPAKA